MQSKRAIQVVSAHAEGEVGRVIVGGVLPPPGDTLPAQRGWLERNDGLRRFLIHEPRGGVFTHYNLIVPPRDPRAAAGFIVMEPTDYPAMSGSNSICVATVLLEKRIRGPRRGARLHEKKQQQESGRPPFSRRYRAPEGSCRRGRSGQLRHAGDDERWKSHHVRRPCASRYAGGRRLQGYDGLRSRCGWLLRAGMSMVPPRWPSPGRAGIESLRSAR